MRIYRICISLLMLMTITVSCNQQNPAQVFKPFVKDIIPLEGIVLDPAKAIQTIADLAGEQADSTIILNKSNMDKAMQLAVNYDRALIVVGNHTLIRITDGGNCQKSTTWNCQMPKGKGITRKDGAFVTNSDHINQIIGAPDKQVRKMFLFKKN